MEEKRQLNDLGSARAWYDDHFRAHGTWPTSAEYAAEILRLIGAAARAGRRRLLDVACGGGHFLSQVPAAAFERFGVDLSVVAVGEARRRAGLPIAVASAEALPFPDRSMDVLVCLGSFEHFVDKEASCAEFARVTRPGGRVVVLVPHDRHWIDSDPQPIELVGTPEEWCAWFARRGFVIERSLDTGSVPALAVASPACTVLRMTRPPARDGTRSGRARRVVHALLGGFRRRFGSACP